MKKILLVIGVFLFGGLSAFAYQYYGDPFKDDGKIADWAKTSVYKMKDAQVIGGYADGNFGPDDYVTRAQLAAMFDRYSEGVVNKNIYEFVYALDNAGYLDLKGDDKSVEAALIVAEAGFFMLDNAPKGYKNGKPDTDEFYEDKSVKLPSGYSYYHEVPYAFYLRYKGDRFVGQDSIPVDEWFGPFSGYDAAYNR